MIAATASIQKAPQEWKWPLDLRTYDKAAALSTGGATRDQDPAQAPVARTLPNKRVDSAFQTGVHGRFSTHRNGSHLVGNIAVRSCG